MKLYAKKETVRKYYKYKYEPWTQPVLSSNGTLGGSNFACTQSSSYLSRDAWRCFDGNTTSTYWTSGEGTYTANAGGSTGSEYIIFYNPNKLNISNLQFTNRSDGGPSSPKEWSLYGSDDNSTWDFVGNYTNTVSTGSGVWEQNINNFNYKYGKVLVTRVFYTGAAEANIGNIHITATENTGYIEATEDDYDFYEEEYTYNVNKHTDTYYWKYVDNTFVQPVLSSNGTLGGDNFACAGAGQSDTQGRVGPAWYAFDKNMGTEAKCRYTSDYILFYNPQALNVSKLVIDQSAWTAGGEYYYIKTGVLSGSNDGSTWTTIQSVSLDRVSPATINVSTTEYYRYYKLAPTGWYCGNWWMINEITITATYKTVEPATPEDYDFITYEYTYNSFKR